MRLFIGRVMLWLAEPARREERRTAEAAASQLLDRYIRSLKASLQTVSTPSREGPSVAMPKESNDGSDWMAVVDARRADTTARRADAKQTSETTPKPGAVPLRTVQLEDDEIVDIRRWAVKVAVRLESSHRDYARSPDAAVLEFAAHVEHYVLTGAVIKDRPPA